MRVTMKHLFTPAVTVQYPDARMKIPERGRNRLYVNMDDCIGCNQCAMACPVNCITLETAKALPTEDLGVTSTGQKKRLWLTQFDIDFGKCCYCGLCVPPCPTECIYMTDVYEFSEYDRKDLVYNFMTLTPEEAAQKVKQAQEAEREAAAKKAAAAAAQKAAQAAQKPPPAPAGSIGTQPSQPSTPAGQQVASGRQPQSSPSQPGAATQPAPTVADSHAAKDPAVTGGGPSANQSENKTD